jgi:hypothetical protein
METKSLFEGLVVTQQYKYTNRTARIDYIWYLLHVSVHSWDHFQAVSPNKSPIELC